MVYVPEKSLWTFMVGINRDIRLQVEPPSALPNIRVYIVGSSKMDEDSIARNKTNTNFMPYINNLLVDNVSYLFKYVYR